MSEARLYQICYSQQSQSELDPGFAALDNLANERPDWREYWPIRRFLLSEQLDAESYYGFFSPKFRAKTGLDAGTVRAFIRGQCAAADVISFSPYFDQMAFYSNIVEQVIGPHGECLETFKQCAALIAPGFALDRCIMTSVDTIFCNFFVAKPRFWSQWLRSCELIFALGERAATPLGRDLNRPAAHGAGTAPVKVFVIERVASLLLWSQPQWVASTFSPLKLPLSPAIIAKRLSIPDFVTLDSMKLAYTRTGAEPYLRYYRQLRQTIIDRLTAQSAQRAGAARETS